MQVNIYTLDINHIRKFLFSRLGTQLFLVCIVGCLFFNIMMDQSAAPPAEPAPKASEANMAKAKEILAAAVEAYGGLEKLQAVKNIVIKTRATANSPTRGQMQIETTSYYLYPDKFRQDFKISPGGQMGFVFDGVSAFGYVFDDVSGMTIQPLPPERANAFKDTVFREPLWMLTNLSENEIPIQYGGTGEVDGKPADILLVPQPTTRILQLFVSQETHHIVKFIHRETTPEGVTADRETFMDDYRDVEGIKVAHRIVQKIEDQVLSDSRVTEVILNAKEIDESVFQKPGENIKFTRSPS